MGNRSAVRASHILVKTEAEANELKKQIKAGEKFHRVAKRYSTCPSKDQGGDLGFFERGAMVPEFEEAAFKAPINTVAGPVKTQFGFHLIMVTEVQEDQH
jgi:peptidyl-prolyl cis-trans isomerase C